LPILKMEKKVIKVKGENFYGRSFRKEEVQEGKGAYRRGNWGQGSVIYKWVQKGG